MLIARKIIKTSLEEIKDTIYWFEEKIKDFNIDGRIILVFNELLLNAYEHGNLSLGSKKKEELLKENCYEKELEKLQKKCNKKIYIYIYRYGNFLFTKIIDEGRGFDVSSIVSKKESFSGRGILISKKIADIFYNQKGNVVCFVMKIKKGERMNVQIIGNRVLIEGNIKSIDDSQKIKSIIDELGEYDEIVLDLKDSISITSALIGYLTKLSNKKNIILKISDEHLYNLLDDLGLIEKFNVEKA